MKKPIIYWTKLQASGWNLYIAATEKGLCYVGNHNGTFEELLHWAKKTIPDFLVKEDREQLTPYGIQISEYLTSKRITFTIPLDYKGTIFQQSVWKALCGIPYGETTSYSSIAERIQKPTAVRAVGAAIGKNPLLITIPCHRVLGKNGALTGYRGGLEMKKQLLILEEERLPNTITKEKSP